MRHRVLVSDPLSEKGLALLRQTPGIEVDLETGRSGTELASIIGDYDALIVRSATRVDAGLLAHARRLRIIGRAGTGVDNIDVEAATKRGVIVVNAPGGNTVTTAEHAIALLLSLCRKIPQATASMKGGKWEKKRFLGTEIFQKTLGIIGLGNIGKIVADRAKGLGMRVIAHDPYLSPEVSKKLGVEAVAFDDLLRRADFITLHTPLNDQTRHILDRKAFERMKRGVKIVNCARGGLIDEAALLSAIDAGIVSGAALDVFEVEPPPPGYSLLEREAVIATPHLGASTAEAQDQVALSVARTIRAFLLEGTIENAVNVPAVSAIERNRLAPWLKLAGKMGSFLMQFCQRIPPEITITYAGEILQHDLAPLTCAFLKGFMQPMDEGVNFVNAPWIARERGIAVREIRQHRPGDYQSEIAARIDAPCEVTEIAGTVFEGVEPRIIRIGDFRVETAVE
ncbi:MAG: phosphoglycerate dehydrogenase, partial [Deltaproteobacteria bacterium]